MTLQEIFDHVVKHLRAQQAVAWGNDGRCAYKTNAGLKCAAGCLIPEEDYKKEFEGLGLNDITRSNPARDYFINRFGAGDELNLIIDLQAVHDYDQVLSWEVGLDRVAEQYSLTKLPLEVS